ncbi:MAG: addiction module antidote protein [Gammaproteobacteria bacterium]
MKTETKPYDPALFLKTDEDMIHYLNEAFRDDDPTVFIIALGDIAKIKGIAQLANETGLNRESLYKALSGKTQPKWDTVQRIIKALHMKIQVAA